jgi:AcrR family transcriptional regulator
VRVAVDHRDSILQTAAKLFARKPFHEVLMDEVAEQTGIAKGTVYRYFANKDDLFGALSMRYLEMLSDGIGKTAESDATPLKKMEAMLIRMVELIYEHNDFFQVMQRHESNLWVFRGTEFLSRRNRMRDHFVNVIADAEQQNLLTLPFPRTQAADMLLGMVRNLMRFSDPQPSPRELARMVMQIFVHGLKSRGANSSQGCSGGME